MRAIGGVLRGASCAGMSDKIKFCGQFVSQGAALFGMPHPVVGVHGLQTYAGVFDGVLHNREELTQELRKLGYRFAPSNTAVMLHAYMAWGAGCAEKFIGTFACAVWDGEQLFIARDRLGVCSLFYSTQGNGFAFSTSLDVLFSREGVTNALTAEGAAGLVLLGPARAPGSEILQDVYELPPGHYLTCRAGEAPHTHQYWTLRALPHLHDSRETASALRNLLSDNINKTERVPAMLSGGVGSGVLAAAAGSRETFSLGFVGGADDSEYVAEMVRAVRSRHTRITLGADELADAVERVVEIIGLPAMGDIDAATLLFCEKILEHTAAVLCGEGADALFGYPWFTLSEDNAEGDTSLAFPWSRDTAYRAALLHPTLRGQFPPQEFIADRYKQAVNSVPTLYDDTNADKHRRRMFAIGLQWYVPVLTARFAAISAALELDIRTPFLDHRLAEYLFNVSSNDLLREVFGSLLPYKIRARKKSPAFFTHSPAYLQKISDMLENLPSGAPIFDIIDRGQLAKESAEPWFYPMHHPQMLAYFLQINKWLERYNVNIL